MDWLNYYQIILEKHLASRLTNYKKYISLRYNWGSSLRYGYLINPMKMRSLWESKPYLSKCCQPLKLLIYLGKRFKAFHALIIESVNQRYSMKVGGLKKSSANSAISAKMCASTWSLGSSVPGFESFSKIGGCNFAYFWPT